MRTSNDPLAAALFGKSARAILGLLYGQPHRRFYVREIARAGGTPPSSLQRELAAFARAGVIQRTESGHQVYYQADSRCPIFEELKSIAAKTIGIADVLRSVLSAHAKRLRAAFIYGSVPAGSSGPGSDIDLMVIGDVRPSDLSMDLAGVRERLGRNVSLALYSPGEFASLVASKNHFLASVLKGPVIWLIGERGAIDGLGARKPRQPRARKAAKS